MNYVGNEMEEMDNITDIKDYALFDFELFGHGKIPPEIKERFQVIFSKDWDESIELCKDADVSKSVYQIMNTEINTDEDAFHLLYRMTAGNVMYMPIDRRDTIKEALQHIDAVVEEPVYYETDVRKNLLFIEAISRNKDKKVESRINASEYFVSKEYPCLPIPFPQIKGKTVFIPTVTEALSAHIYRDINNLKLFRSPVEQNDQKGTRKYFRSCINQERINDLLYDFNMWDVGSQIVLENSFDLTIEELVAVSTKEYHEKVDDFFWLVDSLMDCKAIYLRRMIAVWVVDAVCYKWKDASEIERKVIKEKVKSKLDIYIPIINEKVTLLTDFCYFKGWPKSTGYGALIYHMIHRKGGLMQRDD